MSRTYLTVHFVVAIIVLWTCFSGLCLAQTTIKNKDRRYGVHWQGVPLHKMLARFTEDKQFGFLLDRRIDPSLQLDFMVSDVPLEQILTGLAGSLELDCSFLGNIVYFSPKGTGLLLQKLLEQHEKAIEALSSRDRSGFRKKVNVDISFLESPKESLEDIAKQIGFAWKNLDDLPHDIWNKTQLSGLSPAEALTLLLFGFELDYRVEDRMLELIPVVPIDFEKQTLSDSKDKSSKNKKIVSSKTESLEEKNTSDNIPLNRRRFTLKVEDQNLAAILDELARRMNVELEIDKSSLNRKNISLEQLVSLDVKNATAQQLFRSLFRPLKIDFRLQGDKLKIY